MAFGDVKDFASNSSTTTSGSNTLSFTDSIAVNVGDLIFGLFVEATTRTVTAASDNLGNTYTALSFSDAGAVTARPFFSRVTVAGSLAYVIFSATASSDDHVRMAVVFEGPVPVLPSDATPTNITSDITSPFSCPATGTLTQADELVIAWGAANYATTWSATSPMIKQVEQAFSTLIKGVIASKVVASTATTTPEFTAASNPTEAILGTVTFKGPVAQIVTVTQATVTLTGKTVTVGTLDTVPVTKASVTLAGKTVTIRELELVSVTKATVTVDGQTVVILSAGADAVGVDNATVTLVGKTVTVTDTPAVITIDKAVFALTGKSVGLLEKTAITKATVTFVGGAVTIITSTFEDVPKYIIRGRGSRHGLWTQGYGGDTIKGRGSRAFLVMR